MKIATSISNDCPQSLLTVDLALLEAASTGKPADGDDPNADEVGAIVSHLANCSACARRVQLFVAAERALAASLDAISPRSSHDAVADTAWIRARRYRARLWLSISVLLFALVTLGMFGRFVVQEAERLLAPPPPVVTATFSLSCLSPEQAVTLLRPYLPLPRNPRWQAEHFSVDAGPRGIAAVTVRAPREVIQQVPALLARFEQDPGASCRR